MSGWLVRADDFAARRGEYLMRHGSMRAMPHRPTMPNRQSPHTQDELYLVMRGGGAFTKNGETVRFGPGDAIFVEAGAEHRFEAIDDDLLLWIVFWGPDGGEED